MHRISKHKGTKRRNSPRREGTKGRQHVERANLIYAAIPPETVPFSQVLLPFQWQHNNLLTLLIGLIISEPDCRPHIIHRKCSLTLKAVLFHLISFLFSISESAEMSQLLNSCTETNPRIFNLLLDLYKIYTWTINLPCCKLQNE